ncbi:peptide chain release factor N(5)-glutamine methyltransferase [Negadavirga shengliensis]|uniref:Release factor glutamine methyltransferase n=1 Tax=Negadavirga shengliensis TaxID=1389218 RepID=A0ABV9SVF6_9BACT
MNSVSLRQFYRDHTQKLQPLYPKQEAESLVLWLLDHFLGIKRKDILSDVKMSSATQEFDAAFQKLSQGIPVQYILKSAPFYGRTFKVGTGVLIPRRETEELVHLILTRHQGNCSVLDIGTGSGCIPITLALEMPESEVYAMDVSGIALAIARENASDLKARVKFFQVDVLEEDLPVKGLDIVVSNPPYVKESEKKAMHPNVLQHEPHLALFVPDEDPLLFYRRISEIAPFSLTPGGYLYFEINETLGKETKDLLENLGYEEVTIYGDLNGKDRFVSGRWCP